ncbi:DUF4136 domain-containing protein [Oceanomicrobium pacificus]|uniref:DUF4136 domain-containing protein n=1 Tax=Oceanomicrobium pacificus TaxID=2692916 RepID=A0A6B0TS94_9RHOB|nr:DUF4136 domain-containing protein [Oceanomicrobium pacificus]MXU64072.1 DUF4136 domain-containing protein [Oceanomicrobium pacificus]
MIRGFAAALLSLTLLACTPSVNGGGDLNPAVDVSRFQTFSWAANPPLVSRQGDGIANPVLEAQLEQTVAAVLRGKGYRFVSNPAQADFVVGYTIGARERTRVSSAPSYGLSTGFGGYYGGFGLSYYQPNIITTNYTEGQFAIDILDRRARQPAYHGVATRNIYSGESGASAEIVQSVVLTALRDFPSRAAPQ